MKKSEIKNSSRRTRLRLVIVVLLVSAAAACASAPPPRYSGARQDADFPIQDAGKFEKARALVQQANKRFMAGDYAGALDLANASLAQHETFEGYFIKGGTLFRLNKSEESLAAYQKAENVRPNDEQLLLSIAVVHTARGETEKAHERYMRLHRDHPEEPVYAYKVGTSYKLLRDYDKADEYLKKAVKPGYKHLDRVYMQLGDVALERKKYREAEDYFKKAHQINPNLTAASEGDRITKTNELIEEGNTAFAEKKYDDALKAYSRAKVLSPKSAGPYLFAGSVYLVTDREQQARDEFKHAVELNPANPGGYSLLASAHHKMKQYGEALKVIETGLKVAPESYELYNKMGMVYRDIRQPGRAIEAFYQAIKLKDDYLPARRNVAFVLLDEKRYDEAKVQFSEASRLAPDDADLKKASKELVEIYIPLDRGDRFLQAGRYDEAKTEYKKILQVVKDSPIAYNALGRAEFTQKNYNPALNYYKKALEQDPDNVNALQGALRIYAIKKDRRAQNETLAKLRKTTNNDATAAVTLGRIREDEGKLNEARDIYQRLLENDKDNDLVKRRLGYVYYKLALKDNDYERFQPALANLEKAKEYNPDIPQLPDSIRIVKENIEFSHVLPIVRKAEKYYEQGKYEDALKHFEQAYAKLKRPLILVRIASCYVQLGQEEKGLEMLRSAQRAPDVDIAVSEALYTYFMKKDRLDVAEEGFKRIVARHPDAHYSLYKLGIIELIRKNYDSAIGYFNRTLIYKPDFAVAYIARGVVHYERDEKEKAQRDFDLALSRDPDSALAAYNQGVLLYNDDLLDRAEVIFKRIAQSHPHFTDARYQLSYIYYTRGDLESAKTEIEAVVKSNPRNAKYKFAQAQVYEKEYRETRSPAVALELKNIYQDIIREAPESKYAAESRVKLREIAPGERVVHPYPAHEKPRLDPVIFNGGMLLAVGKTLEAVSAFNKKKMWRRGFDAEISDMMVSRAVHVLAGTRAVVIDSISGEVLADYNAGPGARRLLGAYGKFGVESYSGSNTRLVLFDENGNRAALHDGSGDARYFYGGKDRYYRLERAAGGYSLTMLRLKDQDDREEILEAARRAVASGTAADIPDDLLRKTFEVGKAFHIKARATREWPSFRAEGDYVYLVQPGLALIVVEDDGDSKTVELPRSADSVTFMVHDGDVSILIPDGKTIRVLDDAGKEEARIALNVNIASAASLYALDAEHIFYVGIDEHLRRIDLKGTEHWKKKIEPGSQGWEAFSLYY